MDTLDEWIAALADAPTDRSLDGLEPAIRRDIAAQLRNTQILRALGPLQVVMVGLALVTGMTVGGAAAISTHHAPGGPFAAATRLAPSNLLEGVG